MKDSNINRRHFLKNSILGGLGAMAYTSSGLRMVSAATGNNEDYKALVCVFLFGGNDSYNMFTPLHGGARLAYEEVRSNLARPLGLEVYPSNRVFEAGLGFDQQMGALKTLFDEGHLAIQGNVGALIRPILDSSGNVISGAKYPQGLYAHDASQQNWMRGADLNQKFGGWGGRMLDTWHEKGLVGDANFIRNVSISGSNLWQYGDLYQPYSVGLSGKIPTRFLTRGNRLQSIRQHAINQYRANFQTADHLEKAFFNLYDNAIDNNKSLISQLTSVAGSNIVFPNSSLGKQLNTVCKLIEIGKKTAVGRQVFFVGLGGFDTHKGQNNSHPKLMHTVSEAMASFYRHTEAKGIENHVTSFTMSDFGRTLRSNGDGTDHGWAGHQLILGGGVDGNKIYGDMPNQTGSTSLIPTTSNEQMFASLARWFGIADNDINSIFPNHRYFDSSVDYFSGT